MNLSAFRSLSVCSVEGRVRADCRRLLRGQGRRDSGTNPNGRVITPSASTELPTSESTIAELLKGAGYATAHFGKWHVGRASPGEPGFEENDGANGNGGPDYVENPHPKQLYAMTGRGMDFINPAKATETKRGGKRKAKP